MWHQLGSPPQNFRYYKFSELSNDKPEQIKHIDLNENKVSLFQGERLTSVPQESLLQTYTEAVSAKTNKISSLKSTSKMKSSQIEDKSCIDLRLNSKAAISSKLANSMLSSSGKQKSSMLLSKNCKSSMIAGQKSKRNQVNQKRANRSQGNDSKGDDLSIRNLNNAEQEEYSQIFLNQTNKTQSFKPVTEENQNNFLYQMVMTLKQIRDITKESLFTKKKLVKMLEDKSQISMLYDKSQKYQSKQSKIKKQQRKSFKRNTQQKEKSTIKKLGKSLAFQERLTKVQQKIKLLSKKIDDDCSQKKTANLSRTKKKSTSLLR